MLLNTVDHMDIFTGFHITKQCFQVDNADCKKWLIYHETFYSRCMDNKEIQFKCLNTNGI